MNELLNPVAILATALPRYENATVFSKHINREYDDRFAVKDNKVGHTVNVRVPVRYRGTEGDAFTPEDTKESMKPVVVDKLWGVHLQFSDRDLTLTIDNFAERYLKSATETLANKVDKAIAAAWWTIPNFSRLATPGTALTTRLQWSQANVELADNATPPADRAAIIDPTAEMYAVEFGATMFNPQKELADQYLNGTMGRALGAKWSMTQNIPRHTVGVVTGATPLVNGASQTGSSIITDGWVASTSTLKKGDKISFTGSLGVNPVTFDSTGKRRIFTVTADCIADSGGNMTIPISPALMDGGVDGRDTNQTVTASPADNAPIFVWEKGAGADLNGISGASVSINFWAQKDWATLVVVPQELPGGMEWSEQVQNKRIGVAMRLVRGYDIRENSKLTRLEILGGVSTLREDFACIVPGN